MNNATRLYQAIVFKRLPPAPEFSRSDMVILPGQHTSAAAWRAVYAELEGPGGGELIGGTIRQCAVVAPQAPPPFCGNSRGKGCGKPLLI